MAKTRRAYEGAAAATTISGSLSNVATSITIAGYTNWPYGSDPFYIVVSPGTASEEKMLVTRTGNTDLTLNVVSGGRAADGTLAVSHADGAETYPVFTATDADEANAHVNDDALHITAVTASTRPSPATANQVILQTDTVSLFARIGGAWVEVSGEGAQGAASDKVFWENDQAVTADYTITSSKHAGTFGPVSIDSGVTVTIPSGSVWTVV